jgi:general secretion pathway protein A
LNYLDYFGLLRPPFARLTEPSEIYDVEQYSLLISHLDRAAHDTDHLVVLRGADGSGKTTLLNRYVAGLDDDTYFATVDETCNNETEFYCSFLRQLGFDDITGKSGELRRIAREFLVHRAKAGDTVLLIIDNVQHVSPSVLEQLRLIADTVVDGRRVISAVITGNSHIRRIIQSPAMQQLRFREFVDFHLRVYSERETGEYVRHRLKLAGVSDSEILTADAYPMIYRFTGGVPGKINSLCEALLVDAVERKANPVTGELVRFVAESKQLPPYAPPLIGQDRRKTDTDAFPDSTSRTDELPIATSVSPAEADEPMPRAPTYGPSVDVDELLARLARVSEQIDRLKSDKRQAEQDIGERDATIAELAEKLGSRSDEARELAKALRESAAETRRLRTELDERAQASGRADERIGKLEALQSELHETVTELRADISNKQAQIANLTAEIAAQSVDLTSTLTILSEQLPAADDAMSLPVLEPEGELPVASIARFDIIRNGKVERTIEMSEMSARYMIGRDEDCDLCLDSKYVSRHHALLLCMPTQVSVEDLNSFNGTKVNFQDVSRRDLLPDDVIIIGDFLIRARRG